MKLKKMGLLQQLIFLLALTMLTTFLVVSVSTQFSTRNNIMKNAISMQKEALEIKTSLFDVYLNRIKQLADNLYSNADVYNQIQIEEPNSTTAYRIHLFLTSLRSMSPGTKLYQIYLDNYSSGQGYVVSERASSNGPSRYHIKMPSTVTKDQIYGEGPLLSSSYGYSINTSGTPIYSFHYRLHDSAHIRVLGTISFDVEITALQEYLFGKDKEVSGLQYLIQDPGEIIFTNSDPLTEQQVGEILTACEEQGYSDVPLPHFSGIAFAGDATLGNLKFHILQMVSYEELYSEANRVFARNLTIMLTAFLVACLLMIWMFRQVTRPIRDLDAYVRATERQGLHPDSPCHLKDYVNYDREDELGHLAAHTEQTFLALQESFTRQEKLNQAFRTAEAKMLQAQINPHFLYNSLQSIASVALQHGDKDTFHYITQLGGMMQYSMNLEQTAVELKKEFEHVKTYISLQNVRFAYELRYEPDLSTEAENILVPKMILQPLAGNAYKHGQVCHKDGSYFRLKAQVENGCLLILAENNGELCPKEKLAELNQEFQASTEELSTPGDSGIGLKNVLHRLRIFFGPDVSMKITSEEKEGTRILVRIPLD